MKNMNPGYGAVAGCVLVILAMASAFAHSGAKGIVKERMLLMGEFDKSMKTVSAILQKKNAFNRQAISEALTYMRTHSGTKITSLFPQGSTEYPSEVRPETWENWEEFERLSVRLGELSRDLERILLTQADNGSKAQNAEKPAKYTEATSVFLQLRGTCTACHEISRKGDD